MLSPIEKLLAIEEIKNLKARYFRFVDSHDWPNFRAVFADDAVFGVSRPPHADAAKVWDSTVPWDYWVVKRTEGGDAIIAWVQESFANATSVHQGFMPEIEILSADEARGIWGMEDIVRWPTRVIHGYGYYKETYVRRNGTWLIKTTNLVRKSLEVRDLATTAVPIVEP